jgi:protein-S-isoprenylcysteine O-methyltransferase Ste14
MWATSIWSVRRSSSSAPALSFCARGTHSARPTNRSHVRARVESHGLLSSSQTVSLGPRPPTVPSGEGTLDGDRMMANKRLWRRAVGAAVFFVIAPGAVAGVAPWIISGWWHRAEPRLDVHVLGVFVVGLGVVSLLESFVRFVLVGHGTPAPAAPPNKLVVSGQYRFVRNPMYVALIVIVLGQGVWLSSRGLLAYATFLWGAFHWQVVAHEEPTLAKQFGESFAAYRRGVPRWLPRLTPWRDMSRT